MLSSGRSPTGSRPHREREASVSLTHLSVFGYQGFTASMLRTGSGEHGMWQEARTLLHLLMRGDTIPAETAGGLLNGQTRLLAEYLVEPTPGQAIVYDVRFEVVLAMESREQALRVGRPRQPFPVGERLTYVEQADGRRSHRRKAFDTMNLSPYDGVYPQDVRAAIARRREKQAELAALRLLAARLGRSFLFLDDFYPLALQSAHLKPGAFFLRVLRAWAEAGPE